MSRIVIVGAGWAGFTAAKRLEKLLGEGEAEVVLIDPRPYMTYQGILPEVVGGSVEPDHAVIPLRRELSRTTVVTAAVTAIDHAHRRVTVQPEHGEPYPMDYDQLVVTAGGVTRTFPIPGIAENAIGLKTVEEAVEIHNRLIDNVDRGAALPPGPDRDRLLTVVVVGGGFAGAEACGELISLAESLLEVYPQLEMGDVDVHLVDAAGRLMPEVSASSAEWVVNNLTGRGAVIHLDTQVLSAVGGRVELSDGTVVESDLIVWTAGVMANPAVVRGSDLPRDDRGRIRVGADLRVRDGDAVVADAWAAGDIAAVPDLSGSGPGGLCVPNAQHAARQGLLLAKNVAAALRGKEPEEYAHRNLGAVAGLGHGHGVLQIREFSMTGPLAWFAHRVAHGPVVTPSWDRRRRIVGGWIEEAALGRDAVSMSSSAAPRAFFEEFAARPAPDRPAS
ncbi:MAG: FAD-dependent oxidoreductase [Microbacterium sp.]